MSVKRAVLDAASQRGYPVSKHDVLDELDARGADPDVVLAVQALTDDRYVDEAELEHRLDDALGMPDALPGESAIEPDTEWRADVDET